MLTGLQVRAVRHRAIPLASMVLLFPGGSAADPFDREGLVSITAGLLDEGSCGQSALDLADRILRIGGEMTIEVGCDGVAVVLTSLDRLLPSALALLREVVSEPNLAEGDFDRIRQLRLIRLRQMSSHAGVMAERGFARVLYGNHPYGHLPAGSTAALASVTIAEARKCHAALFSPAGATLIVVSDRPTDQLLDEAEREFGEWKQSGSAMKMERASALAAVPAGLAPTLALASRPDATQAELRIGRPCAHYGMPDYHALVLLEAILGGQFQSRLNSSLRETHGYTYGVQSRFEFRRGSGPLAIRTCVGTANAASAIQEALKEIREIATTRPVSVDELSDAFMAVGKAYPQGFETALQVAKAVSQLCLYELPDSHFEDFVPGLARVTADDVTAAARQYLDLEQMTTMVVGDLARLTAPLAELGLGPPTIVTPEA